MNLPQEYIQVKMLFTSDSANWKKTNNAHRSEEGFILVTSMMIMIAVALLGIAATNTATFEMQIAGNERWAQEQFFQADSGINELLARDFEPSHPGNLPSPFPPAAPITCTNLQGHTPFQTYDPDGDGSNVQLYYMKRIDQNPFIGEILACASKGNTIASITAGIEFGLPPGGIGGSNPVGYGSN